MGGCCRAVLFVIEVETTGLCPECRGGAGRVDGAGICTCLRTQRWTGRWTHLARDDRARDSERAVRSYVGRRCRPAGNACAAAADPQRRVPIAAADVCPFGSLVAVGRAHCRTRPL